MAQKFDILSRIREMWPDFEATENDIKNTPADFMQRVYFNFVRDFGFTVTNLSQMDAEVCTVTTHPETIEHIVPQIKLYALVKNILAEIKIYDFNIYDVTDPRPKRTHRFMKALINFWMFCNSRMPHVQQVLKEKEDQKKSAITLKQRRDELRKTLNDIREQQSLKELKAEECHQNVNDLVQQMRSLKKKITATEAEEQEAQQIVGQLTEKVGDLEKQVAWKENTLKEIQKGLVMSPQRLMTRETELKHQVSQRKERLDQLRNTFTNLEKLNEAFQQSVPLQQELLDLFDEAIAVQNKVKEASSTLKTEENTVQQSTQALDTLSSRAQSLRVQEHQLEEELAGKETAIQDQLKALDEQMDYVAKELAKAKKNQHERDIKRETRMKEIEKNSNELDEETDRFNRKMERNLELVVSGYEKLVEETINLYNNLNLDKLLNEE